MASKNILSKKNVKPSKKALRKNFDHNLKQFSGLSRLSLDVVEKIIALECFTPNRLQFWLTRTNKRLTDEAAYFLRDKNLSVAA